MCRHIVILLLYRFLSSDGLKLKPWTGSVPALEQNGLPNGCDEEIAPTEEKTQKKGPDLRRQKSLVVLTGQANTR